MPARALYNTQLLAYNISYDRPATTRPGKRMPVALDVSAPAFSLSVYPLSRNIAKGLGDRGVGAKRTRSERYTVFGRISAIYR